MVKDAVLTEERLKGVGEVFAAIIRAKTFDSSRKLIANLIMKRLKNMKDLRAVMKQIQPRHA